MQQDADQLRQRNQELEIINHIAGALNQTTQIEEALSVVLADAAEHFGLETGWVWLLNPEDDETYLAAAQNLPPSLGDFPARMHGGCFCIDTYFTGDLDEAANISIIRCSRLRDLHEGTGGLQFHASVPLNVGGKKLGLLNLASAEQQELSQEGLRLLHTIGDLLGIAIERNRLFQQSQQLGVLQERSRLAREIHDTLAQQLTGVALQLEWAEALLEGSADAARVLPPVQKALRLTRQGMQAARRSVTDLRAAPLEGRPLPIALQRLAAKSGLNVTIDFVGEHRPLPPNVAMGLYRIAEEALNNVRRHARADKVLLHLVITPEEIRLSVRDNGVGFVPDQTPAGRYGLIGMNERARLLGGALVVESCPDQGTAINVTLPPTT